MGLWYALIVSALCCLHYGNVVRSHCIDLNSNIVSQGLHYVPGTNPCTVCICDKGSPKWCKSVLCSAPQNCKSFQVGSTCCEFKCLDDILTGGDGYKETYDVALRFIASAVTAVLSLSLLFFLFHRLRRRKVLLHQNQQIGDDQRSLSSIGYIAGSLGYLPESYLGSGNNELEFHYEDSSAHYSLWKPPGDYFPRGEAPPPYEEAVRSAQVDNDLINTQLRTASNTILNSITSIPRGVNAGSAGVATLTTGGSSRNSQVIQNIHDTVVCRHDMLNGSGGSTSVCTTSTEPTSSINNRPIEAPQYTNTNAHHHHIHTTNNSNNNTNNHQQHQQQQYVNITVQNVVVHNNNTHSNTSNNTHSISNNTHSTSNSTHSSGNNVHSIGNSLHSTGNNSHSSSSNTHSTNNTAHSTSNNTHSITNSTHQNTNEMPNTALKQRKQDITATATTTTTKPHHHKMTTSNSSFATTSVGHHGNSTAVTSSVTPSQSHQQAACGAGHVEIAYENLPFIPERKHMGTLGKTRPSSSGQLKHRDSGGSTLATGGGGNSGDKTAARHGRMLASHYHQQQQTQQQQAHSSSNGGGQQHHREQHTHHGHTSSSRNIKNSRSQECLRRGNRRNDETSPSLNTPSSSITSGGMSSTSSSAAGISRILDGYKNIEVIRNKDTMIITEGISSHQAQSLKAAPLKLLSTVDRAHHRGGSAAMLQPLHRTLPRDLSELLAKSVTAEDILLRSSGSGMMSTYSSRGDTGVTAAAAQQMVMSTPMTESSATTSKFMSYQCLSSSQEDEDYRSECENCKSAGFTRRSRNASGGAGNHGVGAVGDDDEDDDDDDVLNETMTLQRRPLDERPTDEVQYYRTSLTLPTNTRKPRPTSTITTREAWFTTMQESSSSDSE